jgi:hypothetical protein
LIMRALSSTWWWLTSLFVLPCLAAEPSTPSSAQERLEAIKLSLIEATLQSPTTVKALSWIDKQGQLHELSVFKNTQTFHHQADHQESPSDGQVKVHLDSTIATQPSRNDSKLTDPRQQVLTDQNHVDACHQSAVRWRHALRFVYQPDARLNASVDRALKTAFKQSWLDAVSPDQPWVMVPDLQPARLSNSMTPYERSLTGPEMGQQAWRVILKANTRKMEAPDPLIWPTNEPWVELNLSLRLIPADGNQSTRELQAQLQLPVEFQDWSPGALKPDQQTQLRQQIEQFKQQLDIWFKCEPFQPKILRVQGSELIINAGQASGIQVGDEWLIAPAPGLHRNWMQDQALQNLRLTKVSAVDSYFSKLIVLAGPPASARVNDRAIAIDDVLMEKYPLTQRQANPQRAGLKNQKETVQ